MTVENSVTRKEDNNPLQSADVDPGNQSISMLNYIIFWSGQKISVLGSEIVAFAITWYLTIWYESTTILSLAIFFTVFPKIIIGPLAGVIADKFDLIKILIIVDFMQAILSLALIILIASGYQSLWLFLIFNGARAVFQALQMPVNATMGPLMLPKAKLTQFEGLNQLAMNILFLIAPIFGALLINVWTLADILWIDLATFAIALITIIAIKIPKKNQKQKEGRKKINPGEDFREGIEAIGKVPGLWAVILLGLLTNFLLAPTNALMTYFVNVTHGGTVRDMAIFSIVSQISMVLGSVVVMVKKNWNRRTTMMMLVSVVLFSGLIVMALSPVGNFWVINIGSFAACAGIPIFTTFFISMVKMTAPLEKMGRISGLINTLLTIIFPLGVIISGPLADLLGISTLYVICSILGIFMSVIIFSTSKMKMLDKISLKPSTGYSESR